VNRHYGNKQCINIAVGKSGREEPSLEIMMKESDEIYFQELLNEFVDEINLAYDEV
jgi:hypothetical protein